MANIQVDLEVIGGIKDLLLAVMRYDFTGLELRVIGAVIFLTYGNGKTKSEMTTEDIRYTLGADKKLRTDRLEEAITKLLGINVLFRQELVNGKQILALQKDYDKWNDKMSPTLQDIYINNTNNTSSIVGDKMSRPELLLVYAQRKGGFKYGVTSWRVERKYAKRVYVDAIRLTGEPQLALLAIKDYIDTNEWMRKNVKHQFTYMDSRFEQWFRQVPRKTKAVLEDEQITGKRFRWNIKLKAWEVAE